MKLIDLDDYRNCYIGMDGEYEQWNIDPNVLAEAQPEVRTQMSSADTISRAAAIYIASGYCHPANIAEELAKLPSAQSEITDEQAIEHLQSTGWMQNHDREMYESGLREQLADDSGSYDSLLPSAQPQRKKGRWIPETEDWRNQIVWVKCSECGFDASTSYNFCPNCGAKMEGGWRE